MVKRPAAFGQGHIANGQLWVALGLILITRRLWAIVGRVLITTGRLSGRALGQVLTALSGTCAALGQSLMATGRLLGEPSLLGSSGRPHNHWVIDHQLRGPFRFQAPRRLKPTSMTSDRTETQFDLFVEDCRNVSSNVAHKLNALHAVQHESPFLLIC